MKCSTTTQALGVLYVMLGPNYTQDSSTGLVTGKHKVKSNVRFTYSGKCLIKN